jgi:hypothetical protein
LRRLDAVHEPRRSYPRHDEVALSWQAEILRLRDAEDHLTLGAREIRGGHVSLGEETTAVVLPKRHLGSSEVLLSRTLVERDAERAVLLSVPSRCIWRGWIRIADFQREVVGSVPDYVFGLTETDQVAVDHRRGLAKRL